MNAVPPKLPTLARSADEVQRAHDILWCQVMGREAPRVLDQTEMHYAQATLEVLCWVLGHDHVNAFPKNLDAIEAELERRGFKMHRHHELFQADSPPTQEDIP